MKHLYHFTNDSASRLRVEGTHGHQGGLPSVNLMQLFPGLEEEVAPYSFLDGTSRPTDLALLRALARRTPQGRYIEFGTWRGESIANVAPLIAEAWAITFSTDAMRSAGASEGGIRAAHCFSKDLPNLKLIEANTQTYDFKDLEGQFDLVFVDADHEYPGVTIDTRNAFRLLRDERSVIVWHDYGKDYETVNWQVARGILDGAPSAEHRKNIYHVTNTLCAIYTKQPLQAFVPELHLPDKQFSLRLKMEPLNRPAGTLA